MKKSKLSLIAILLPALFFMGASSMVYAGGGGDKSTKKKVGVVYAKLEIVIKNQSPETQFVYLTGPKWKKEYKVDSKTEISIKDYNSATAKLGKRSEYKWKIDIFGYEGRKCHFEITMTTVSGFIPKFIVAHRVWGPDSISKGCLRDKGIVSGITGEKLLVKLTSIYFFETKDLTAPARESREILY